MMDLKQHLIRQMVFSKATFGDGERREGVLDHITKEIEEVRKADGDSAEWVDIVILSLDGLTRRLWSVGNYKNSADEIADTAIKMIVAKQGRNERRDWPDWRTAEPNKAIEHIRSSSERGEAVKPPFPSPSFSATRLAAVLAPLVKGRKNQRRPFLSVHRESLHSPHQL